MFQGVGFEGFRGLGFGDRFQGGSSSGIRTLGPAWPSDVSTYSMGKAFWGILS